MKNYPRQSPLNALPPMTESELSRFCIALIIPAYNVANQIEDVLREIPSYIRHIIVVNDASKDQTGAVVKNAQTKDSRIILLEHKQNCGVGGAMATGFRQALSLNAQIAVKIDGDGQMNIAELPWLLAPLIIGKADYAKGNRFYDFNALRQMPLIRQIGNMGLSFLAKVATGYWHLFDPTNGYVAIRYEALTRLTLDTIDPTYFFEHSILSQLYLIGAVVRDVPLPARYGSEKSNLSIRRVLLEFPPKLAGCFLRRIILKTFLYDFNMQSIYLLFSLPMFLGGASYGTYYWFYYAHQGTGAPVGTVVIPAMLIILGIQLLLAAIEIDLRAVPSEPLSKKPLDSLPDRIFNPVNN